MSHLPPHRPVSPVLDPRWLAPRTSGVLGRRLVAWLIDFVLIWLLIALLAVVIAVLGAITLGLAWGLYLILLPGTGILYSALTVGGTLQATPGMRVLGLRAVDVSTGGRVEAITAAVHALFFYIAAGTFVLWLLDVGLGLARTDRRLAHDLLLGVAVIRAV